MKLKTVTKKHKILAMMLPKRHYPQAILKTVKELKNESICYVTLNKTAKNLQEFFVEHNVDSEYIVFLDGLSHRIHEKPVASMCYYYLSPVVTLEELYSLLTTLLKHNFTYVIFDMVANLQSYSSEKEIYSFFSQLLEVIKEKEINAIFYLLNTPEQKAFFQKLRTHSYPVKLVKMNLSSHTPSQAKKKNTSKENNKHMFLGIVHLYEIL